MSSKRRAETLSVLVGNHRLLKGAPELAAIYGEFNNIARTRRGGTGDGWLLAVLHTTRALDTTLYVVCRSKSGTPGRSIGGYLTTLRGGGILQEHERARYQSRIAEPRNYYMHQAGAHPNRLVSDALLSEMHDCLSVVLSRV